MERPQDDDAAPRISIEQQRQPALLTSSQQRGNGKKRSARLVVAVLCIVQGLVSALALLAVNSRAYWFACWFVVGPAAVMLSLVTKQPLLHFIVRRSWLSCQLGP